MKYFLKFLFIFFFFLLFYFFLIKDNYVYAANFFHEFSFNYEIKENGEAYVILDVITTNLSDFDYIESIEIEFPFKVKNVDTSKSKNPIELKKLIGDSYLNNYFLTINFLQPVIGKNKTFEWNIFFEIEDVVLNHGIQKVIILPKFMLDNVFMKSKANIKIPKKLGNIQYVYGADFLDSGNNEEFLLSYKSDGDLESNFGRNLIVLLGDQALFKFDINIDENSNIILPMGTTSQEIFYENNVDWDNIDINLKNNTLFVDKSKSYNANIIGYIISKHSYDNTLNFDSLFTCSLSEVKDINIINIINELNNSTLTDYDKAKKLYIFLSRYNIIDYSNIYTGEINDILLGNRTNLNVFELNSLFRYLLCLLDIKSRFVMGYVFPIQPLKRIQNSTYQHTWVEFWDGNKWVSTDPSWYISSKGDLYFDKNNFHHITFSYFYDFYNSIIEIFQKQKDFINIVSLDNFEILNLFSFNNENIKKVNLFIEDKPGINKKVKLTIQNLTNKFLFLEKINFNCEICNNDLFFSNLYIIKPFSYVEFSVKLDYFDFIIMDRKINIGVSVNWYNDISKNLNSEYSQNFDIFLKSNLSIYFILIANLILVLFILFILSFYINNLRFFKV